MRVHLTFTPPGEEGHLPINYNTFVSEFVYELLQPDRPFRCQPDTAEGIPFYTFSNLYIPEVQQEERTLRFGKVPIELTISILVDPACEQEVLERMQELRILELDNAIGTPLEVASIDVVKETQGMTSAVRFRMLSPLASPMWDSKQTGDQRYIHYNDPEFSDSIRGILLAKYERWKGKTPNDTRFRITLDEKYVQRRRGRISKLVTFHEGESDEKKVKAIVSPFEVEGNPELIWLGYVSGFGEKNLLGFGCADVVSIVQKETRPRDDRSHDRRGGNGGQFQRSNRTPERQFAQHGGRPDNRGRDGGRSERPRLTRQGERGPSNGFNPRGGSRNGNGY